MLLIVIKSKKEMQKIAGMLAKELKPLSSSQATVLALEGNLGSGKTTFTQGLASALGVREKVLSPTFVLAKIYQLPKTKKFKHLIHIDCYRLKNPKELEILGFKSFLDDPKSLIVIEWADKIRKMIPKNSIWINFEHGSKTHERLLITSEHRTSPN